jgi:type II secretory pathway pseudopilin PulG
MNSKLLQTSAAVLSLAIFSTACENLSPGENAAVFGVAAGLATGIPLGVSGVNPAITIPVTAGAAALAAGAAYVIAKQQASERQRKIAEQRARLYLAEQQAAAAKKKSAQTPATKAKKSRYIAVRTVKEESNQGKEQVMIFDTQSNQVVGNNVYDLKSTPKVGQTSKFDTYTAEYVGSGS